MALAPVSGASPLAALASSSIQTSSLLSSAVPCSSVLSSAVLPQFMQSLTPLGGSGDGGSKEIVADIGNNNVASSFTSQDNCIVQAPQAQAQQLPHLQQMLLRACDTSNACVQPLLPDLLKDAVQGAQQNEGDCSKSSDQRQSQQQKAASALAKYQEFIRQQQMPPPQLNQPSSSSNQMEASTASISQHTNQPQPLAANLLLSSHQSSDNHVSEHLLRSRGGDSLPVFSSPALSQSLSLNQNHFLASPIATQATASPMASRLPKVLPSGDGRSVFIVLPGAAHADAVDIASTAAVTLSTAANKEAHNTVQLSNRTNRSIFADQCRTPTSERTAESDGSDAETQNSAVSNEGQEETLVIPETPTGTPIQPHSMRVEDSDVSGAVSSRHPRPHPFRLADSDAPQVRSSRKSSNCDNTSALISASSGKSRRFAPSRGVFFLFPKLLLLILFCFRNAVYAKIVALPTQPAAASVISSVRMSSRGRTIRPKVNFDSLPHHNSIESPGPAAVRHSRLEKGTSNPNLSTATASASKACNTSSIGEHYEDDVPLVGPIIESRHAPACTPAKPMAVSLNETPSVKRTRKRCHETAEMQIESCKKSVQFKGPVESDPVVPLIELNHMSFIVTNVSRCLPCLCFAFCLLPQFCIVIFCSDHLLMQ